MRNLLYIVCLSLVSFFVFGQEGQTILDKNQLLVGEQFTLTYHVTLNKTDKVNFKSFNLNISAQNPKNQKEKTNIEIVNPFDDTIIINKGKREWFGSNKLTAWDSGFFQIQTVKYYINGKTNYFPAVSFSVDLVKSKKGQDIYDIKESFVQLPSKKFSLKEALNEFNSKNGWWFYSLVLILIGFYIFYRLKKRKKNKELPDRVEIMRPLSLKEKTILAIENLEKKQLWTQGLLKEHYVELSYILREYLSKRYTLSLIEKTTYESKLLLTQKGLPVSTIDEIAEILNQSDMVKFAKSEPEEITVIRLSSLAKKIVEQTSSIEIEDAE
jgi:hypothetical protein